MGDSRYWFEERLGEQKEETPPTQNVLDLVDLYRLLSFDEKISAKKLINSEKIFGN